MARRQVSTLCALKLDLLNTWTLDGGVFFFCGLFLRGSSDGWGGTSSFEMMNGDILTESGLEYYSSQQYVMFGYVWYFNHPPTGDSSVVEFLKRLVFDHRHQQGRIHHHCLLGLVT
jgi:hypothetical protein